MVNTIFYTFSLCLLLSAAYSKPLAHDSKSMQSSNGRNTDVTESMFKLDAETVVPSKVESARETDLVQSLHSVPLDAPSLMDPVKGSRRTRRQVITTHGCAKGRIWFMKRCMSFEKYERLVQENEQEK